MRLFAAIGIVLALSAVSALAGDFEDGLIYYQSKNYASAMNLWRKAAAHGSASAQFALGFMYEKGEGVVPDNQQALSWYGKAGEQGHVWAQSALGLMYETAQGVALDYKQALSWYQRAAEQGDPLAQFDLGRIYETGREGVGMDYIEAHKWW